MLVITSQEIESFVALANEARTYALPSDPASIARHFGIEGQLGASQVRMAIYARIRDAVVDQATTMPLDLRSLKSALVRRSRFKVDAEPYYRVPERILYGVNEFKFRPVSEREAWIRAISAAYALMALPGESSSDHVDADWTVTNGAQRLQARSYRIRLDGGDFVFEEGEFERCCRDIDGLAERVGGMAIVYGLLKILQNQKRFQRGRYRVGRQATVLSVAPPDPSIPYGYLFNVALRHMGSAASGRVDGKLLGELIAFATDFITVADIETYSVYGFMFTDHAHLPRYLQRLLLGDFLLGLRQLVPEDALTMIRGLFNWVDPAVMKERLGWTVADAIRLAEFLLRAVGPDTINMMFRHRDLAVAVRGHEALRKMLPAFVHRIDELNRGFTGPMKAAAAEFDRKPLVWQPGQKVLLISPPLCAIGFFEALAATTRGLDPDADKKIGLAAETMLANAFRQHGIAPAVVSGAFKVGKTDYNCDLAVETTDAVILFEVKKKSLTRAAMGGDIHGGLVDLCLAMIKAQSQLGIQEIELLKHGELRLANGDKLELRKRRIERVAVTLLDWGSIQYRSVVDNVHKVLASSNVGATSPTPEQAKAIAKNNRLLVQLSEQNRELSALKGQPQQPFFDWTFLGIPQILFMLDGVTDADGFYANLRTAKHMVTGSLDTYETLTYMQNLRAAAASAP